MSDLIKGNRTLSENEVSLMNRIKELAEDIGSAIRVMEMDSQLDQRWVEIGKTDIQKGFMSLVRSVGQPDSF